MRISIKKYSFALILILFFPNLHAVNTGLPYVIHLFLMLSLFVLFFSRKVSTNNMFLVFFVCALVLLAIFSLARQFFEVYLIMGADLGFLSKLLILASSILVASVVGNMPESSKCIIIYMLVGMVAVMFLQAVFQPLQYLYNNSNLIDQRRFGSIGITHYEACAVSIILGARYLSCVLMGERQLYVGEAVFVMFSPLLFSVASLSKAAIIISVLWMFFCFFYIKRKIFIIKILFVQVVFIFLFFHDRVLVVFYGLSDLFSYATTTNLSIVTRFEDFNNFYDIFSDYNISFVGVGPNRWSYFHYFEVGVLANISNIGVLGAIIYYFLLLFLCLNMFVRRHFVAGVFVFSILFLGDCLVNFTDGVKSLLVLGFASAIRYTKQNVSRLNISFVESSGMKI